jgi:hypothetical protein
MKREGRKSEKVRRFMKESFSEKTFSAFFINFTRRKVKAAGKNVEKILFRGKFTPSYFLHRQMLKSFFFWFPLRKFHLIM